MGNSGRRCNRAMYALLDIAENRRFHQGKLNLEPIRETPRFSFRAIKFNLPWSPYREGEQMDLHSDVCRDLAFWEEYLDMMAQNRLNVLSLWSRHPFPFMIRAKTFPKPAPSPTQNWLNGKPSGKGFSGWQNKEALKPISSTGILWSHRKWPKLMG
ncbi:MAG: hypothetical protein R3C61_22840 [Bacteroidia bacterium]